MRILLNGINLHSAGGRSLGRHLLRAFDRLATPHELITLVADASGLAREVPVNNIQLVELKRRGPRMLWRTLDDLYRIRAYCRRYRPDVCYSLGDIGPIRLPCPHVVLLHNPWLLYDTADLAKRLSWRDRLVYRRYYPWYFRRLCATLSAVAVQTPVVAQRLLSTYPLSSSQVRVIPSACTVPTDADGGQTPPPSALAAHEHQVRLLFLARFYPHKNHDVLLPVLQELRRRHNLDRFHFFLTVDDQAPAVRKLLDRLAEFDRTVTNLGPLPPDEVPQYLAHCHALFLPTLLETFGLVYLEAMACGAHVLTSDRDFSRYVCEDYADFFEPTDPQDIVDTLSAFADRRPRPGRRRKCGGELLERKFVTWEEVARVSLSMLESVVSSRAAQACPAGATSST